MSELTPEQRSAARQAAATAQHQRSERTIKRLFMTDAECHLRSQNHAECSRAGIVDHQRIRAHGDALVASLKPVLEQTQLTGPEVLELRREMARAPMSKEAQEARFDGVVQDMRRPIYGTKKQVEAQAATVKAAAHASPALKAALNRGNAANSVGLTRAFFRRVADDEQIVRKPEIIIK